LRSSIGKQDPVHKISIIPRGIGALGYTIQRPTEDRFLMTKEELENRMAVLLGGRAAEYIFFHHLSIGAADDLVKATDTARSMVLRYGNGQGNVVRRKPDVIISSTTNLTLGFQAGNNHNSARRTGLTAY
jgi:cell division protease FtsH